MYFYGDQCEIFKEKEAKPEGKGLPMNPYSRGYPRWVWIDGERKFATVTLDAYDIAQAYGMSPPIFHAFKKLCDRGTGEKTREQELREAIASIERAISLSGDQ